MTAREAIARATLQLEAAPPSDGIAQRDALLLLLHTLNISRAQFYADPDRRLTANEQAAYSQAIARRLTNEPIQYITGEQEFYGLALRVTPAVLIPRPETEHLVEAVLAEFPADSASHILDVGTGSGAIAIALAHHLLNAQVTATDISADALKVAATNAARHNLAARIRFVESNLLGAISPDNRYDAIVSNPPYIPTTDHDTLHPQVREYEPNTALFAGPDGLEIYRCLIPQAQAALKPNGLLALEIGHGQRDAIAALLNRWTAVRFITDLQQFPRVAIARNA